MITARASLAPRPSQTVTVPLLLRLLNGRSLMTCSPPARLTRIDSPWLFPTPAHPWFLQDRREDVAHNIQPALARGQIVVLDRYYFSTIAYQGALQLDPEEIRARNEAFAPPPDLLFLLHLPAAQGLQRVRQRGTLSHFEGLDYLERVAAIFAALDFPYLRRIDATADALAVQEHIWQEVASLLARTVKTDSPVAQEDTA